jgi:hypothetical protein
MTPGDRLRQIDANLGFIRGTGIIIREARQSMMNDGSMMKDGIWIISMPVPRSQIHQQINNLIKVLTIFEQTFGIIRQGLIEINVSGRCTVADTEKCLGGLIIPSRYMNCLVMPDNTPYRYGHIVRINEQFMCFRTRWFLTNADNLYEDLTVMSQLISSMYR